jgi:putative heme iron utilization protein
VVEPARLSEALAQLPDRQIRLVGTPTVETLWDKPFVWVLLMVILCTEWIGRRLIRLP